MSDKTLPQRNDYRRLLAEVSAWAHAAGWTPSWRGWQNAATDDKATVVVGYDDGGLRVWRKDARGMFPLRSTDYPVDSIREALEILAAIRVLPLAFSPAYRTGRSDERWVANVDVDPNRRCRRCGVRTGLKPVFAGIGYGHAGWECRHGCTEVARAGQRPAEPGELCTCGRQAVTVFTGGRFGDTGYCGLPDGGQSGPCRFCGGPRHEGQRCPQYVLRPAGGAS